MDLEAIYRLWREEDRQMPLAKLRDAALIVQEHLDHPAFAHSVKLQPSLHSPTTRLRNLAIEIQAQSGGVNMPLPPDPVLVAPMFLHESAVMMPVLNEFQPRPRPFQSALAQSGDMCSPTMSQVEFLYQGPHLLNEIRQQLSISEAAAPPTNALSRWVGRLSGASHRATAAKGSEKVSAYPFSKALELLPEMEQAIASAAPPLHGDKGMAARLLERDAAGKTGIAIGQ